MRLNVYSIFDTASGTYRRPFFMMADGEAMRVFSDMAANAEHEIGAHPEDYSLVRIGTYDDNKARLVPENVETLATALELVARDRNVNRDNLENLDKEIDRGQIGNGA